MAVNGEQKRLDMCEQGSVPLYLFHQGTNAKAYEYLGLRAYSGEEGAMSCRVWAPNALAVSLVGDFNAWNEEAHPLHKVSDGVWACFLPEMLPEFTLYKFCVTAKDG